MSWRERGCYLWRCDKPYALLGLPFIGRHNAYVGQSNNRRRRDRQHIHGDVIYGAPAKDWSDLRPKVYALPILFPGWRRARLGQEWLYIRLLMPVYNVQHNHGNLRRIKPATAAKRRLERQAHSAIRQAIAVSRLLTFTLLWSSVAYLIWSVAK